MSSPPTYFVVCLHEDCSQDAADYIADLLRRRPEDGGAGLLVHQESMGKDSDGLVLHVSASRQRLLRIAADDIGVKKRDSDGVLRVLDPDHAESFECGNGVVGPLTLSDVHRCILFAMEMVHFRTDERHLPGHDDRKVMKRAPVLASYREAGLIDSFPLHDDEALDKLYKSWSRSKTNLLRPPVQEIRDYFGENVALYFAFLSYYTVFLFPIAGIGVLQLILDKFLGVDLLFSNIIFAGINLVAVTVFLEFWKRRSNKFNYLWGTGGKLRHKRPRPEFRGDVGINPITGQEEIQYPAIKTAKKIVFVSLPITVACLLVAFFLMLASFEADRVVCNWFRDAETGELSSGLIAQVVMLVPTVLYSVVILLLNQYYLHLAHHLTEWENHRTQEQFERHVVCKLVLFEFINTFLALFYIAFYLQDLAMLRSQVFMMLIVSQIVNQLQETILPIVLRKPSTKRVMNKISKKIKVATSLRRPCKHCQVKNIPCLDTEDSQVVIANYSLKRDPYESTYDDFMEIWLQFGHVFLFSSMYPLAGFFALLNNLVELWADAYKLCKLSRKPTPRAVRDIGAWYLAFSVTSVVSIMTNCVLLSMDPKVQSALPDASQRDWILLFVVIEHVFLLIRIAVDNLIPDVPKEINFAMDRDNFILSSKRLKSH